MIDPSPTAAGVALFNATLCVASTMACAVSWAVCTAAEELPADDFIPEAAAGRPPPAAAGCRSVRTLASIGAEEDKTADQPDG